MLAADFDCRSGKSDRRQSQGPLPRELPSVACQSPRVTEPCSGYSVTGLSFLQGSYGVVKLAYNENDNTYYVSIPVPIRSTAPSAVRVRIRPFYSGPLEGSHAPILQMEKWGREGIG